MTKYYTKKEAADTIGCSLSTIEKYTREGLLTPLYPGGIEGKAVRFASEQVENFFKPASDCLSDY